MSDCLAWANFPHNRKITPFRFSEIKRMTESVNCSHPLF